MFSLIDSHAHLGDTAFEQDVAVILARAKQDGLEAVVDICTDAQTLKVGLDLKKNHPWIYLAAASTPHDVGELDPFFDVVAQHVGSLVAIGETGLDYYYEHAPREHQQKWLRRYLALARDCDLPVVIHCREAFKDFFCILDSEPPTRGVLHCFTGTLEEARGVIDRGWYLSLSGIVTYKKSEKLREIAAWMPLDRLLVETDAPYLAPQTYRGKRNEPAYVLETVRTIAEVRGQPVEEIAFHTSTNARKLFGLPID